MGAEFYRIHTDKTLVDFPKLVYISYSPYIYLHEGISLFLSKSFKEWAIIDLHNFDCYYKKSFSLCHFSVIVLNLLAILTIFLPLLCPVSVKFSVHSFLIICPRYFRCLSLFVIVFVYLLCSSERSHYFFNISTEQGTTATKT